MASLPKIAIIDDEADLLYLTAKRLRSAGFDITTYMEGKGAYDFVCREKPDLILLDIWLPDISGIDIFKQIRASRDLKNIPILFFSAHVSKRETCVEELKAEGFIKKPYNPKHLISLIKQTLNRSEFPSPEKGESE